MREISVLTASTTSPSATSSPQTLTAATSSSPTSTAATSSPPPAPIPFSDTTDTRDSEISSGIIASIVAGAVVAACILVAAGVLLLIRWKGRYRVVSVERDRAADHQSADVFTGGKSELDSSVRTELDARAPAELDVRAPPAELDVRAPPAELDAQSMKCSSPAKMISTSATLYITQRVDIRSQPTC
ncbi:hypothetical protein MMC07_008871 [Pseudocyphellaria aurata]|nr:hypothetical protein [Pseudocyphellaria aurata]